MDKIEIEENIKKIVSYNKEVSKNLKTLFEWVENESESREILEEFLEYIWLENNAETRLWAYFRIVELRENSLVLYMEKAWFSQEQIDEFLDLSYNYVSDFYSDIQKSLLNYIEENNLLTDFYTEIFRWVYEVGIAFNSLFLPWRNHIVNWVNRELESRFENDTDKIMQFLNENNLLDLWHNWEIADRSYSSLVINENGNFESKSYFDVFKFEVNLIVKALDKFIKKISCLEDYIYSSKDYYIDYLTSIKNAFLERDVNKLVVKWSIVDEKWMEIKTPFQISHPLEFYEDKYRQAVAPEWDLRIKNEVFESTVKDNILDMYEKIYDDIWRDRFKKSYEYSLWNINRVNLFISTPILYFSSELTWLFSAQVVPNDDIVSEKCGKKIFAFPEMVLEDKKSRPFLKWQSEIFSEDLLDDYRKYIFWDPKNFYKVYDVETIGHEFWHTLWLDLDTESKMNSKTWVYKNIEEFKATAWWLVAYFVSKNDDEELRKNMLLDHINRTIGLFAYKKVNEVVPYYCEALIHFQILMESRIIKIVDNKIVFDYCDDLYEYLKEWYINHYLDLVWVYLNKVDANEFLKRYTIKEGLYYLPQNEVLRNFVNHFTDVYNKYWNEIDNSKSKEIYM